MAAEHGPEKRMPQAGKLAQNDAAVRKAPMSPSLFRWGPFDRSHALNPAGNGGAVSVRRFLKMRDRSAEASTVNRLRRRVRHPFSLCSLRNPTRTRGLILIALPAGAATEGVEMFAQEGLLPRIGRSAVMAAVSAVVLTSIGPAPALAGSASSGNAQAAATAATASRGATDLSARRRVYRNNGGAAAAAAFASIVGTGIAIAAAQNRGSYYDDYYGGGPVYYGGGPVYYGDGPYYGYGGGYRSGVPRFKGHPLAGW
jgi:hypothetical protein